MTPEQRSRELASKATPGPWDVWDHRHVVSGDGYMSIGSEVGSFRTKYGNAFANAAFIAYHDPSYIKAMADVVERGRALVAEVILGLPNEYDSTGFPGHSDTFAWWDEVRSKVEAYLTAERSLDALVKERK